MVSLYDLSEQMASLIEQADRPIDSEFPEDVEGWIHAVVAAVSTVAERIEDKLEQCEMMSRQLGADAVALKLEEDRFRARRKALENHRERLRHYMAHAVLTLVDPDKDDRRRVQGARFLHWVQRSPMSVNLEKCDTMVLREPYVEYVPQINGAEIIRAVKADGVVPDGAALNPERWHIRSK